jgi:tetratricopeptide (TPR) repeat protein
LGVLYTQAGLTDTAIEQFDEALKIARDDQEALLYAGIAYLNKGDYDQAIKYFDKEIKYYKNTALAGTNISLEQAYYYSAVIHWREKDYDLVIDNAAKALKIKASSADTHLLLGRAYYEKKSYDEAIASFDQALRFDPTYPDALYGAGLAYEGKGDKEKALEQYRKALKAKPDFKQAADAVKRLESAA